jgi:hypothetical protein
MLRARRILPAIVIALIGLLIGVNSTGQQQPPKGAKEIESFLRGRWRLTKGTLVGPKDPKIVETFVGRPGRDRLSEGGHVPGGGAEIKFEGLTGIVYNWSYRIDHGWELRRPPDHPCWLIDPNSDPVGCDLACPPIPRQPNKLVILYMGILRIDGKQLHIAVNYSDKLERPKGFDPFKKESLCHCLLIYERAPYRLEDYAEAAEKLLRRMLEEKPDGPGDK